MKNFLLVIIFTLTCLLCVHFLQTIKKTQIHLAIIPHFMLAWEKVDEFYAFLKDKRYSDHDPDTILIISPNHFNQRSTTPQTICEISSIYFQNHQYTLTPFPGIDCTENIFFPFGNSITTNEHGIGEQLPRIAKYFPTTKTIIPLILPTHLPPLRREEAKSGGFVNEIFPKSSNPILWNLAKRPRRTTEVQSKSSEILYIASVDFSHYLSETIAQANDEISITTIQSWTWTRTDFRSLDVDCPSCLYLLNEITKSSQSANLYRRDSSSTILWKDMHTDNTSRVFMYYEPHER